MGRQINVTVGKMPASLPGFTSVLNEQFVGGALNTGLWYDHDGDSTNGTGSPTFRDQTYLGANLIVGTGSSGSTGGTSAKFCSNRQAVSGRNYTAAMMDSQTRGVYWPRYGRYEWRVKTPHGQGLWPALWLTGKNGGAGTIEWDAFEYFHGQVPGRYSITMHGKDNSGTFRLNAFTNNVGGRTFFEAPTYTPGWHTFTCDIIPVTDATGATPASNPAVPSSFVKFISYLDGVPGFTFVDSSATYWTTNGGTEDSFWNMYVQGCQVDGRNVGGPDDPLGYSHVLGACLIGGTAPNSCTVTSNGYTVQRIGASGSTATFLGSAEPATTLEVDYIKVWKYTG